jgi:four helix bundle protein
MNSHKYDLDERLINFATRIILITETLPKSIAGLHLSSQLVKSGTSPALNYGEAQGGESRKDFIHKMRIALKELRETFNCLRIIRNMNWHPHEKINPIIEENNQLIAIFYKSVETAKKNIKDSKLVARQKKTSPI